MTAPRVFPEPDCRHLSESEEKRPHTFIARMRFHQSWYRAKVLDCDPGPNPNANDEIYGSMLDDNDTDCGRNFLSMEIFEIARERYLLKSGSSPKPRVYSNLLSSEPMCFNLFAPLRANNALAAVLLKLLPGFPQDATVTDVRLEYTPSPKSEYLSDSSAFDCYVKYERANGSRGFVGIETKLTEPFSRTKKYEFCKRYSRWMSRPQWWWKKGAEGRFSEPSFNQLWRNHLLAFSMLHQLKPDFEEGYCAVVYPTGDRDCGDAISDYRKVLTEGGAATLLEWQLENVVSCWERALNGREEHDWITRFRQRYLDLEASDDDWQKFVRNIT